MIQAIIALLTALPEILAFIKTIQKAQAESDTKRKVADDINLIHVAFSNMDSDQLNRLFGGK